MGRKAHAGVVSYVANGGGNQTDCNCGVDQTIECAAMKGI